MTTEAVPDTEADIENQNTDAQAEQPEYVEVVDPFAPEISFLKSECPEKRVIRVICDQLGKLFNF